MDPVCFIHFENELASPLYAVLDVHDASLACNVGGDAPAGLVAEAQAGSTVTFTMIRVRFECYGHRCSYIE